MVEAACPVSSLNRRRRGLWGAECHAVIQGLVQAQNRVDRRRLAGAGAAGQHHHVAGQRQLDGLR